MNRLPPLLAGGRRQLLLALLANGLAQAALLAAAAWLISVCVNTLTGSAPAALDSLTLGAGFAACYGGLAWLRWRGHRDAERLGQGYVHAVRMRLFRRLLRSGSSAAANRSVGALALRFVGDLNALRNWVSLGVARLLLSGLVLLIAHGALLLIAPLLGLVVLGVTLLAITSIGALGPLIRRRTRAARRQRGTLAGLITDRIDKLAVVEAYGQEQRELLKVRRHSRRQRSVLVQRATAIGWLRGCSELSAGLAAGSVLLVGIQQVNAGQLSPATVVAAMSIAGYLTTRLAELSRVLEYYQGYRVAHDKLLELLNPPVAARPLRFHRRPARGAPRPADTLSTGTLSLCQVATDAIAPFDLQIPPGSRVRIEGANGSGKSTLLRLLAGIDPPRSGQLYLDAEPLPALPWQTLRQRIVLVTPEHALLRASLRYNLCYGHPGTSEAQLQQVIESCGLAPLIERLPRGLETRLSSHDARLSSGERGRIVLARALLMAPQLLLLDEPDANLDQAGRRILSSVLEGFAGSVVLVSHHPFTLPHPDLLLRLEGGKLLQPRAAAGRCTPDPANIPPERNLGAH